MKKSKNCLGLFLGLLFLATSAKMAMALDLPGPVMSCDGTTVTYEVDLNNLANPDGVGFGQSGNETTNGTLIEAQQNALKDWVANEIMEQYMCKFCQCGPLKGKRCEKFVDRSTIDTAGLTWPTNPQPPGTQCGPAYGQNQAGNTVVYYVCSVQYPGHISALINPSADAGCKVCPPDPAPAGESQMCELDDSPWAVWLKNHIE